MTTSTKDDAKNDADDRVEKRTSALVLLSWLSMILPSTGFRISPRVFCATRKEIEVLLPLGL